MIKELTKENLLKEGLTEKNAVTLYTVTGDYIANYDEGNFFISKAENKYYTGIDFYRKTYMQNGSVRFPFTCPDLFNEYFELTLNSFFEKQKVELSIHFDEKNQFKRFISKEKKRNKEIIKEHKEFIKSHPARQWIARERTINLNSINNLDKKHCTKRQNLVYLIF